MSAPLGWRSPDQAEELAQSQRRGLRAAGRMGVRGGDGGANSRLLWSPYLLPREYLPALEELSAVLPL